MNKCSSVVLLGIAGMVLTSLLKNPLFLFVCRNNLRYFSWKLFQPFCFSFFVGEICGSATVFSNSQWCSLLSHAKACSMHSPSSLWLRNWDCNCSTHNLQQRLHLGTRPCTGEWKRKPCKENIAWPFWSDSYGAIACMQVWVSSCRYIYFHFPGNNDTDISCLFFLVVGVHATIVSEFAYKISSYTQTI